MALPLRLHNVDDAEGFAAAIAARTTFQLTYHEREDLKQFLLVELWRLSTRFDASDSGISFSTWAGTTLRRRTIDWRRGERGRTRWQFSGRTYERPRPQVVSIDDPEFDRLGMPLPASSLDDGEHRLADELRSANARARRPAGRDDWLGDEAA